MSLYPLSKLDVNESVRFWHQRIRDEVQETENHLSVIKEGLRKLDDISGVVERAASKGSECIAINPGNGMETFGARMALVKAAQEVIKQHMNEATQKVIDSYFRHFYTLTLRLCQVRLDLDKMSETQKRLEKYIEGHKLKERGIIS